MIRINEMLPGLSGHLSFRGLLVESYPIVDTGYNEFTVLVNQYRHTWEVVKATIDWFIEEHNIDLTKYQITSENSQYVEGDEAIYTRLKFIMILTER